MNRLLIAAWGVAGVIALLLHAVLRLTPRAIEAVTSGLDATQWVVLAGWVVFMAHSEGYRGFHARVAPRLVARAWYLADHPRPLRVALAPAYCLSLFGASPRGVVVARVMIVAIALLVVLVSWLEQPWRGIVDAGVVVGLAIGLASVGYFSVLAVLGRPLPVGPDLPADEAPAVPE